VYLSDVDLCQAVKCLDLIVRPFRKEEVGATSIDLHLDSVEQAKVWDFAKLAKHNKDYGLKDRELNIARMTYGLISREYLIHPPRESRIKKDDLVFKRDDAIILRPHGFLVWQTVEKVGTPIKNPKYICFIEGKSTRARTGLVVHMTAPTIHAAWHGKVTLEMTNCGPLDLILHAGDCIAQITVAQITQPPQSDAKAKSATFGQKSVHGR
jgi:deoxycytidine triphosphate deaminase